MDIDALPKFPSHFTELIYTDAIDLSVSLQYMENDNFDDILAPFKQST